MIINNKQLKVTQDALKGFLEAIKHYDKEAETEKIGPTLAKVMLSALGSEVEVLEEQIEEYLTSQLIDLIPKITEGHDCYLDADCPYCEATQICEQLDGDVSVVFGEIEPQEESDKARCANCYHLIDKATCYSLIDRVEQPTVLAGVPAIIRGGELYFCSKKCVAEHIQKEEQHG